MMKKSLKTLLFVAACAITPLSFTSCEEPNVDNGADGKITISNVVASYSTVTFDVVAEDATVIAYACAPKGETMTAAQVFDNGTVAGKAEGTFTCKGLKSETEYQLMVVASRTSGLSPITKAEFTTLENTGTPVTEKGAGIRITEITTNNVFFDITNGTEADFSYVAIWGKATIENQVMEMAKEGVSREDAIKEIMKTQTTNSFTVMGKGEEAIGLDYQTKKELPLYPDHHYLLITVGCTGTAEQPTFGDMTVKEFTTESFELEGQPEVDIKASSTTVSFKFEMTPNDDTKYYFYFGTYQEQIDEYTTYLNTEFGEELGEQLLKEFVMDYSPEYTDKDIFNQTIGFDFQEYVFGMIVVATDKNYQKGAITKGQVQTEEEVQHDPAEFNITFDKISSHSARYNVEMGPNCFAVFTRTIPASQAGVVDQLTEAEQLLYARDLWDQGWGFGGNVNFKEEGTSWILSEHYYVDLAPGNSYVVIATGLNYHQNLTTPLYVSEPFTTDELTWEGFNGNATISLNQATITMAKFNYRFDDNVAMIYHRIQIDDETSWYYGKTDDEIRQALLGSGENGGNMWLAYESDDSVEDHLDWTYTFTGMEQGTKYIYYIVAEDFDGHLSDLIKVPFSTVSAEGGPNPAVEIAINSVNGINVDYSIIPNGDCSEYYWCFVPVDKKTPTDETELNKWLQSKALEGGMRGQDVSIGFTMDMNSGLYDHDHYLLVMPYGEKIGESESLEPIYKQGELQYIKFKTGPKPEK